MSKLDPLLGRTLLVMAHPDDECLAYGTLLQRMREPHVAYMTDGAPRDPYFWKNQGSRENYARLRQQEARRALSMVGVENVEFMAERAAEYGGEFEDQRLFRMLPQALRALMAVVERIRPGALATLAYEGGHPDHDACNALSAAVGREFAIAVWEAPLYHRAAENPEDRVVQDFVERDGREVFVEGTTEELRRKRAMCAAYPSQGDFLETFHLERELVRPLHDYDYAHPPHAGRLNYEAWEWPMTGPEVSRALAEFLASRMAQPARQPAP